MIPGPINLGRRGLSIGGRGLPQLPTQPAPPEKPTSNLDTYGLVEALQPIDVQSGHPLEAISKAIAGGLRGIAVGREREGEVRREQNRYADALEQQNIETKNEAEDRDLRRQALEQQAQPETRVTQSGTFWREGDSGAPTILGRDPNWQPPAALTPQQWQPLSPQTRQNYPNLNPGDVQENAVTGEIAQIPGASQRQRTTERQQRSVQSALSSIQSADNVLSSVQSALRAVQSNPTMTTGWVGARLRGIEGSPAYDLDRTIDTIKANLGFEALSQMRAESPTGGALGNVTEIELRMLQAVIDSLDSAQSAPQLEEALTRVQQYLIGRQQRMQRMLEAYEQDFGSASSAPAAPAGNGIENMTDEQLMQLREQMRGG